MKNTDKIWTIVLKPHFYYLVDAISVIILFVSSVYEFNLIFSSFLGQQDLIISFILALISLFLLRLLFSYDSEYLPVPTSGTILTVPTIHPAKTISYFLKKNFKDLDFDDKFKNELVQALKHEKIHWKISKRFKIKAIIQMKIEKNLEEEKPSLMAQFWYNAYYPQLKHFNKYYPKYLLVQFIQFLFDFIEDLTHGLFFYNFHMRILDHFSSLKIKLIN